MTFEPGVPSSDGMIPLSVPEIRGNEWKYIKECLDTNWVSSAGSFVDRFEEIVSLYIGCSDGVATVNGTAALHTALLVAGVGPEDEVLVPTLTFIAPVNAIRYAGATPVFMDAEPNYWQMDPGKIMEFLDKECNWVQGLLTNKATGRPVKAILPVHILGHPCDMESILEIANKYNLLVIEDASESLGAKYKDRMAGSMGHIACLSFNGNKLITCGGGGMVITNNSEWANKAHYLTTQAKDDSLEYIHNEIGFNYRLTNLQAAMGVAQMEMIDEFILKKRQIAFRYHEAFQNMEFLEAMSCDPNVYSTYWLTTVLLNSEVTLKHRKRIVNFLIERGIGVRPLWHPIHSLPPYRDFQSYRIEHADNLYERAISLPSSVGLSDEDQDRCIETVWESVGR